MTEPQRYMMATTAHHKLGDISRDQPDLAYIDREDGDDYVGQWVTGAGYIEVRFPKATTRELTTEERERYDGCELEMSGRIVGRIELPEPAADLRARLAADCERCPKCGQEDVDGVRWIDMVSRCIADTCPARDGEVTP